jgi:2-oxoisovalerate dehydrogenase E1 component
VAFKRREVHVTVEHSVASTIEPRLSVDAELEMAFARAFLIRAFEERLLKLFSEGKLFGTVHTCIGQEFTGIAVATHLHDGDLIFSNHRCHGHYLARTGDVQGLLAEIMGRTTGICGGRGGSQHICGGGFFSNGIQGGGAPIAAGMAMAQKLRHTDNIVVLFIGDGTLGEGVLYETLNIVSKWQLPLLIVLENNRYAQSTPTTQTLAGDIVKRFEAFGIDYYHGDTWSPEKLIEVLGLATQQVRKKSCPVLVHIDTYRLMAHSKGDDNRAKDEVEHSWTIDPLTRFSVDHPEQASKLRKQAEESVSAAMLAALASPIAVNIPTTSFVSPAWRWQQTRIEGHERVVTRIHLALLEKLSDERTFLLGEDIEAPYGGAFKVTKDLSLLFPSRVRNTPISEAAIVGVGNGLAMAGFHPVCEIMFGDFLALAADQIINHAAKFHWMYNGQVEVPVVIRTPMGGKRGYGPTHSQCLEKHFLGIPGTRVVALHGRYDPYLLYRTVFATVDRPTLIIENKTLYAEYVTDRTARGFWCEHTDEVFPTTRICSSEKPEITIVCYGGLLSEAEIALDYLFEHHEIIAEIICPTQIYPLELGPILESVGKTRRLFVVEEGQLFCGFGSEVLAAVHEACSDLGIRSRRQGAAGHPLPSSKPAELESLPSVASIVRECVDMVTHD